ncbi:MAG: YciI family protein [Acidobacteriaceae bacterium]
MPKQHFYFKLIPPRPTFAMDANAEELALMKKHSEYCGEQFRAGRLLLYGPVLARDGAFGVGILEVENEAEAREFGENDPSVLAGMNRFELAPMRLGASQASGDRP